MHLRGTPALSVLPVGHPVRPAAGRALLWTFATAVVFTAFALVTTQDKPLRAHSPWQDDPYDAVVSFTLFVVPLFAGLGLARAWLCRADQPLAASRLLDLLRAADVVLVAVALTVIADWVAFAARAPAVLGDPRGAELTAGLALVTVPAAAAALLTVRAHRLARGAAVAGHDDPDWLEDLLAVLAVHARRLGATGAPVSRLIERSGRSVLDGRFGPRRRPIEAALLAATGFALALAAVELVGEPPTGGVTTTIGLTVLRVTIGMAGMFAILVLAGAYLHLVRPAPGGLHHRHPAAVVALVVAGLCVPLAVAFRDQLAALSGGALRGESLTDLGLLIGLVAVTGATIALGAATARSRRRR